MQPFRVEDSHRLRWSIGQELGHEGGHNNCPSPASILHFRRWSHGAAVSAALWNLLQLWQKLSSWKEENKNHRSKDDIKKNIKDDQWSTWEILLSAIFEKRIQTLTQSLDVEKAAAALGLAKQAGHLCEVVNTHWLQLTHGLFCFCSFLYNHTSEEEKSCGCSHPLHLQHASSRILWP